MDNNEICCCCANQVKEKRSVHEDLVHRIAILESILTARSCATNSGASGILSDSLFENNNLRTSYSECSCETVIDRSDSCELQTIPRVFSNCNEEQPVRDVQKQSSQRSLSTPPICSFFHKIMDNAKSMLSMKSNVKEYPCFCNLQTQTPTQSSTQTTNDETHFNTLNSSVFYSELPQSNVNTYTNKVSSFITTGNSSKEMTPSSFPLCGCTPITTQVFGPSSFSSNTCSCSMSDQQNSNTFNGPAVSIIDQNVTTPIFYSLASYPTSYPTSYPNDKTYTYETFNNICLCDDNTTGNNSYTNDIDASFESSNESCDNSVVDSQYGSSNVTQLLSDNHAVPKTFQSIDDNNLGMGEKDVPKTFLANTVSTPCTCDICKCLAMSTCLSTTKNGNLENNPCDCEICKCLEISKSKSNDNGKDVEPSNIDKSTNPEYVESTFEEIIEENPNVSGKISDIQNSNSNKDIEPIPQVSAQPETVDEECICIPSECLEKAILKNATNQTCGREDCSLTLSPFNQHFPKNDNKRVNFNQSQTPEKQIVIEENSEINMTPDNTNTPTNVVDNLQNEYGPVSETSKNLPTTNNQPIIAANGNDSTKQTNSNVPISKDINSKIENIKSICVTSIPSENDKGNYKICNSQSTEESVSVPISTSEDFSNNQHSAPDCTIQTSITETMQQAYPKRKIFTEQGYSFLGSTYVGPKVQPQSLNPYSTQIKKNIFTEKLSDMKSTKDTQSCLKELCPQKHKQSCPTPVSAYEKSTRSNDRPAEFGIQTSINNNNQGFSCINETCPRRKSFMEQMCSFLGTKHQQHIYAQSVGQPKQHQHQTIQPMQVIPELEPQQLQQRFTPHMNQQQITLQMQVTQDKPELQPKSIDENEIISNQERKYQQESKNACVNVSCPKKNAYSMKAPVVDEVETQTSKIFKDKSESQGNNTYYSSPSYPAYSFLRSTEYDSSYNADMTYITSKQKDVQSQMATFQEKKDNYAGDLKNYQQMLSNNLQCPCSGTRNFQNDLDKVSKELKLENTILRNELEDMKLELKQCLERIQGPMKHKLLQEQYKCQHLQEELETTKQKMISKEENNLREINDLKMELCCTCSNINKLNEVNKNLQDELQSLNCMCTKLEDDLVKQKMIEADTIRIITKKQGGDYNEKYTEKQNLPTVYPDSEGDDFICEENLHVIARKLSETLRASEPCQECAKVPPEMIGAAMQIKNLTDLVNKQISKNTTKENKQPPEKARTYNSGKCRCARSRGKKRRRQSPKNNFPQIEIPTNGSKKRKKKEVKDSACQCFETGDLCIQYDEKKNIAAGSHSEMAEETARITCLCESTVSSKASYYTAPKNSSIRRFSNKKIDNNTQKSSTCVDVCIGDCVSIPGVKCDAEDLLVSKLPPDLSQNQPPEIPQQLSTNIPQSPQKDIMEHSNEEIPQKEPKKQFIATVPEEFPYEVETKLESFQQPPDGLHITTTITDSGAIEVITEGPTGVIETTLTYTEEGNIEVKTEVTEMGVEHDGKEGILNITDISNSVDTDKIKESMEKVSHTKELSSTEKTTAISPTNKSDYSKKKVNSVSTESSKTDSFEEKNESSFPDKTVSSQRKMTSGIPSEPSCETSKTTSPFDSTKADKTSSTTPTSRTVTGPFSDKTETTENQNLDVSTLGPETESFKKRSTYQTQLSSKNIPPTEQDMDGFLWICPPTCIGAVQVELTDPQGIIIPGKVDKTTSDAVKHKSSQRSGFEEVLIAMAEYDDRMVDESKDITTEGPILTDIDSTQVFTDEPTRKGVVQVELTDPQAKIIPGKVDKTTSDAIKPKSSQRSGFEEVLIAMAEYDDRMVDESKDITTEGPILTDIDSTQVFTNERTRKGTDGRIAKYGPTDESDNFGTTKSINETTELQTYAKTPSSSKISGAPYSDHLKSEETSSEENQINVEKQKSSRRGSERNRKSIELKAGAGTDESGQVTPYDESKITPDISSHSSENARTNKVQQSKDTELMPEIEEATDLQTSEIDTSDRDDNNVEVEKVTETGDETETHTKELTGGVTETESETLEDSTTEFETKESAIEKEVKEMLDVIEAEGARKDVTTEGESKASTDITVIPAKSLEEKAATDKQLLKKDKAAVNQKRDISCQSTQKVDQSNQCCECRHIGVSTTQDSETVTDMVLADDDTEKTQISAKELEPDKFDSVVTADSSEQPTYTKDQTANKTEPTDDKAQATTGLGDQSKITEIDELDLEKETLKAHKQKKKKRKKSCKCNKETKISQSEPTPDKDSNEINDKRRTSSAPAESTKLGTVKCKCVGECKCTVCAPDIMLQRKAADVVCSSTACRCSSCRDVGRNKSEPPTTKKTSVNCQVNLNLCQSAASKRKTCSTATKSKNKYKCKAIHPPECDCLDCLCAPCEDICILEKVLSNIPSDELEVMTCKSCPSKTNYKKRISINDVFKPPSEKSYSEMYSKRKCQTHGVDCDCLDCICLPTIRKLAETKEYPIPDPSKQVYHVLTVRCACAKTAVRGSKIPISKNSTHPPNTIKPCDCTVCNCDPCADPNKQASSKEKEKTNEANIKLDCDCNKCDCENCLSKAKEQEEPPKEETKATQKDDVKDPCTCGDCECKPFCPISKQSAKDEHTKSCTCIKCLCEECVNLILPDDKTSKKLLNERGHPVDCDCDECVCPNAISKIGRPSDCDCDICVCPNAPKPELKPNDQIVHPHDCNCLECTCPDISAFQKIAAGVHPPDCDCTVCACRNLIEYQKEYAASCDCAECDCSPCHYQDKPKEAKNVECTCSICSCDNCKAKTSTGGDHKEGCTCADCLCIPQKLCTPGKGEGEGPNPCDCTPMCDCPECADPSKKQKTLPCDCTPICNCQPCADPKKQDIPPCDCELCKCDPCADPAKIREIDNCDCEICKCEPQGDSDCICDVCKCDDNKHPDDCTCDVCKCEEDASSPCGAPNCSCPVCECLRTIVEAKKEVAHCGEPTCTCALCECSPIKVDIQTHGMDCCCSKCICHIDRKSCGKPDCNCEICSCPDGTTEKKCGKVDCTCEECMCLENEKLNIEKNQQPQQPTKSEGEICNCVVCKCLASGGGGEGESKNQQSCFCKECVCVDCPQKKKGQSQVKGGSESKATIDLTKVSPSDLLKKSECICNECKCKKSEAPPNTNKCTCIKCQCDVCIDKGKDKANTEHIDLQKPTCECDKCACAPCSKGGKIEHTSPSKKECVCRKCECDDCPRMGDSKKALVKQDTDKNACDCEKCECIDCTRMGGKKPSDDSPKMGDIKKALVKQDTNRDACDCEKCECIDCTRMGGKKPTDDSPRMGDIKKALVKQDTDIKACDCEKCECIVCTRMGGKKSSDAVPPPFEIPMRKNCECSKCSCIICIAKKGDAKGVSSENIPPFEIPVRLPCKCPKCDCVVCMHKNSKTAQSSEELKNIESKSDSRKGKSSLNAECISPNCSCEDCKRKSSKTSKSKSSKKCKSKEDLSKLDDDTLKEKIVSSKKETCKCKEEIKEIRKALDNIRCACTEAELKAFQSKPFVKQASTFGDTMSGLKMALANLEEKCKAKDRMIEAMTGELKSRMGDSYVEKLLNKKTCKDVPDYDKTKRIVAKCKCSDEELIIKEKKKRDKSKKREKRTKSKESKIDMTGFEIVDIRRITNDSIIIKWNPPCSSKIMGYDIFINGVNKSKVMSGERTSAMIHSLDLTSTIQITIYAVTKCGRSEPPAIAIYEICK